MAKESIPIKYEEELGRHLGTIAKQTTLIATLEAVSKRKSETIKRLDEEIKSQRKCIKVFDAALDKRQKGLRAVRILVEKAGMNIDSVSRTGIIELIDEALSGKVEQNDAVKTPGLTHKPDHPVIS